VEGELCDIGDVNICSYDFYRNYLHGGTINKSVIDKMDTNTLYIPREFLRHIHRRRTCAAVMSILYEEPSKIRQTSSPGGHRECRTTCSTIEKSSGNCYYKLVARITYGCVASNVSVAAGNLLGGSCKRDRDDGRKSENSLESHFDVSARTREDKGLEEKYCRSTAVQPSSSLAFIRLKIQQNEYFFVSTSPSAEFQISGGE
jgi:hypothetical protein